jgi:hypothetical protein
MEFIVRLYHPNKQAGVTEFTNAMFPVLESLRPYTKKFEIWNEPNHAAGVEGYDNSDESARAFAAWYEPTFRTLKASMPWAELGFPGLANGPAHRDLRWLDICRDQILMSDWLGCHCYWQFDNHLSTTWGMRHIHYHKRFPDLPIHITECGDSTPSLDEDTMARRMVEYYSNLYAYPYLQSASAFIASSPDPTWNPFTWATEDGRLKPVVDAIGNDIQAKPAIVNMLGKLPINRKVTRRKREREDIETIVVHHSALPPEVGPVPIARYHVNRNGWREIGYHYCVAEDGTISLTNPLRTISNHAGRLNTVSIGICLLGRFTEYIDRETDEVVKRNPTQEQLNSMTWLINELQSQLGLLNVVGHQEVWNTACPGDHWADEWKYKP